MVLWAGRPGWLACRVGGGVLVLILMKLSVACWVAGWTRMDGYILINRIASSSKLNRRGVDFRFSSSGLLLVFIINMKGLVFKTFFFFKLTNMVDILYLQNWRLKISRLVMFSCANFSSLCNTWDILASCLLIECLKKIVRRNSEKVLS